MKQTIQGIHLSEYATIPLYNIKAVVQTTDISPSTLRAWERRYNVCRPQRSNSGYRLYSDRDIAVIHWLKAQVDGGMAIRQAVAWYETLIQDASDSDSIVLPSSRTYRGVDVIPEAQDRIIHLERAGIRNFELLGKELLNALLQYEEIKAERIFSEAISLYTLEEIGEKLLTPLLVEIGEQWYQGRLSITKEHYTTNYLRQRLASILHMIPNIANGPMIWVACAPSEQHDVGAILVSIYLRRAGHQVRYLGADIPVDDFVAEIDMYHPAMVLFSATTIGAAEGLVEMTKKLFRLNKERLFIGYGGQIFIRQPSLCDKVTGVFLGASAQDAVEAANEFLRRT